MMISILPAMSQAISMPRKQAKPARCATLSQTARPAGDALEASLGRLLRPVDRANRSRSGRPSNAYARAVWSRFLTWKMRRATRLVLGSLDDRTLADIGVRRDEINILVREIETSKARWYVSA